MWRYLEPLFIHSDEVKKELPLDTKRFEKIDGEVKATLMELWKVKKVKAACNKPGLVPKLEIVVVELEKCKKSLSEYLSGKKRLFPRFHFTSEADLLDILSNGNQPSKIMRHVNKLMLSTRTLVLESVPGNVSDRPRAIRFEARVGDEIIDFEPAVLLEGKVENYLQAVLNCQRKTLGNTLKRSLNRYPNQARVEWLMDADPPGSVNKTNPAQIALLVAGINYVFEVEATLDRVQTGDNSALTGYHDLQVNQLNQLIELTRSELKRDDRQRIMSLITVDAHARDIVLMLIRENVTDKGDFQWASQLKQRYKGESGHPRDSKLPLATIDILDASFEYGFEFLGNGPRLVITPLTDRIYVTATQALHLKMGCAPAGPAGTGKTETTKDLAAGLGNCCYVFNCSPEMDYQSLGDIFKGLASSGAWGCFDEFNRLVPEVLSVCSLQFKAVTDGLKAYAVACADRNRDDHSPPSIVIEDDRVSLDPGCGVFITMNPGYLGRSELPEGLKVLFRPITVMVPDLVLICENMLMAEGFVQAKTLASKFYGLYSLLQELLSKQDHYDWGMRAVKSVLVVAGKLKRAEPDLPEDSLLMRALRDFNTPKIVHSDEAVFFGLLNDLFPSINPPRLVNDSLNACVREVCEDMNLWPDEAFVLKISQLDELLAIRHCNFVVGQAGAGKSSCWKVLKEARSRMDPSNKVKDVDINPKTMPTEELYGHISLATREWKDGVLSAVMRDLGAIPNEAPKWIVLDGDLDANWIESMNSVMDDNKVLTLASNERIPLRANMRMIFEIRDLKYATPATVSRAGILYISTVEGQQWHSLIASWVTGSGYSEEVKSQLSGLFELYVPRAVQLLSTQLKTSVECEPTTAVSALLQLLEGFLKNSMLSDGSIVEHSFVFCTIWAFGSTLGVGDDGVDYRKTFSDWWRREFNKAVKLPSRDTIFDYFLSVENCECCFEPWTKHKIFKVIDFNSSKMKMNEVTVPTAETASATFWMEQRMSMGKAVMLVGPAGTGKTQLVMGALRSLMGKPGADYMMAKVNMNFYTRYAASKLVVQNISDCQYVAAMNPTAGSFQINPRLQRHFLVFAIGMPSPTSLLAIFETFLEGHLGQEKQGKRFQVGVVQVCASLIKGALSVHKEVSDNFRKTAANFHYEFNMRHLTNVFEGLLKAHPKNFVHGEQLVHLWLHESERVYGDRLACLHVARVSRVLQQAGGHAMLIGVGGSGKQSLAKLAVFMAELAPMTVVISKSYSLNDFKADLQVSIPIRRGLIHSARALSSTAEARHVYTTPKSYLELLKLFTSLLDRKHIEADAAIQRLEGGVLKLAESAEAVANLEENLKVMLASAEEKRAQADKMADQVGPYVDVVRMEREGVGRETENANIEADKVAIIQNEVARKQADAENDLAKAEPAVLAAMSALDTLDKSQLGQCKTMSVPPPGVVDIFIACMVLLATLSDNVVVSKQTGKVRDKDRTWDSVKKSLLGNINGFLEELKGFKGAVDDGSVPEINIREVRPFLDLEHFRVEVIEKRNSAAAGLCSWVLNIVQYYDIVRTVEPKRRALQEANDQLEAANNELGEVRARLSQLEATLAILNAEYERAEGEKQEAQATYERGKTKIELARRLVSSLGGETERWATGVKTLLEDKENLVGDVLVASAFLSYVGPFTKPFREQLVKEQWLPVMAKSVNNGPMPMSVAADPLRVLTNEAEIAKWNSQGLPADPVSSENGAIVDNCARWPLIIDPQLQVCNQALQRIGVSVCSWHSSRYSWHAVLILDLLKCRA
ncbi:unnamed protein product [Ectocarpus sp. CCAP 1310/34]|nr:unnamed protein product [Ectocarpus sp. CCAP 1310/34]